MGIINIKKEEIKYFICDTCGKIRLIKNRNEIKCEVSNEVINERDYLEKFRTIDSLQVCNDCLSDSDMEELKERIEKLEISLLSLEKDMNYLQGKNL